MGNEQLTIRQTPTGYWVLERGSVQVGGGPTRHAAETERDLFERLQQRRRRRTRAAPASRPRSGIIKG